jgi:hypothetical protein
LSKYTTNRPFADPAIAARKLVEIASAIESGWLVMHETETFVRFTRAGAELFPS